MKYSLSLLTAAVLAAAPAAAADDTLVPSPAPIQVIQVTPDNTSPPSPPTFRQRLHNLFHPHRDSASAQPDSGRIAPMAAGKNSPIVPTSKDLEGVGHEKDYTWITGRLARVPGDSHRLMIRYATANETDTYGGSMILANSPEVLKHQPGELVCVYGKITSKLHSAKGGPGAVYQVTQIYLIPPMAAGR